MPYEALIIDNQAPLGRDLILLATAYLSKDLWQLDTLQGSL